MIKIRPIFLAFLLVAFSGMNGLAQRGKGLETSTGLDTAPGLQPSKGLDTASRTLHTSGGLDSASSSPPGLAPRAPVAPRMQKDPDGVLRFPSPAGPVRYRHAKRTIARAKPPSIHNPGAVGLLTASDYRINASGPFVMEYSAYLIRGGEAYFVPVGMDAPIELNREQISSFIAYPPDDILTNPTEAKIQWLREWISYAETKAKHFHARDYINGLIEEANHYINNARLPDKEKEEVVSEILHKIEEPDLNPGKKVKP